MRDIGSPSSADITWWRLVVSPENLYLEIDADEEPIRLSHGDLSVTIDASGTQAHIEAEVEVATPPSVSQRLRQHVERRKKPPENRVVSGEGAEPLLISPSAEEVAWVIGPSDVREFATDIKHRLEYSTTRVVQMLRWLGDLSSATLTGETSFYWSLDGRTWYEAPPEEQRPDVEGEFELLLTEPWVELLQALLREEQLAEPIAWQVFYEAVALLFETPRAAYVLALTAAELGVKMLPTSVSTSESESWLAVEMPSPPMDKLLGGYLPRLTPKRVAQGKPDEAIPRKLRKIIEEASKRRNKIVHSNELPPSVEETVATINAVHDLLYLLDWFSGQDWAIQWVSPEWRKAYDLPM